MMDHIPSGELLPPLLSPLLPARRRSVHSIGCLDARGSKRRNPRRHIVIDEVYEERGTERMPHLLGNVPELMTAGADGRLANDRILVLHVSRKCMEDTPKTSAGELERIFKSGRRLLHTIEDAGDARIVGIGTDVIGRSS